MITFSSPLLSRLFFLPSLQAWTIIIISDFYMPYLLSLEKYSQRYTFYLILSIDPIVESKEKS